MGAVTYQITLGKRESDACSYRCRWRSIRGGADVHLIRAVALGRAGERDAVVAAGLDGVRLWDAASGAELAVLGAGGAVEAVALRRVGDRQVVLFNDGGGVRIVDFDVATLQFGRMLILGPGSGTLVDLVPDGAGGYRLRRLSGDAWRRWRAQGFAESRLVNMPIDDMPRAD
jgi:hypothetical protein